MTNWNLESEWAGKKIKNKEWKQLGEKNFLIPWRNSQGEILCERYYHSLAEPELNKLLSKTGWQVELQNSASSELKDDKGGRNLTTIAIKKAP